MIDLDLISNIGKNAKSASRELAKLSTRKKNSILESMAEALENDREFIKQENAKDLDNGYKNGLSSSLLDRLELTDNRINSMINGIYDVIALNDPVGEQISAWDRPNGLHIKKVRSPIGVICIIFESRPNVTCDAAVLCFKTSKCCNFKRWERSYLF